MTDASGLIQFPLSELEVKFDLDNEKLLNLLKEESKFSFENQIVQADENHHMYWHDIGQVGNMVKSDPAYSFMSDRYEYHFFLGGKVWMADVEADLTDFDEWRFVGDIKDYDSPVVVIMPEHQADRTTVNVLQLPIVNGSKAPFAEDETFALMIRWEGQTFILREVELASMPIGPTGTYHLRVIYDMDPDTKQLIDHLALVERRKREGNYSSNRTMYRYLMNEIGKPIVSIDTSQLVKFNIT